MRRDLDAQQACLIREVDAVIDTVNDARECYARLGDARLLAVHYPIAFGGRDLSLACHAAVSERIGVRGLPDVPHLITVQAVGCAILTFGSEIQQEQWLTPIASGRLLASLLLSEPDAGSDLTRVTTVAVRDGEGWRLNGRKAWSMWTTWSKIALCCVRTREGKHRYDGISLFIVDLSHPGVTIEPVGRACPEPYYTVTFDDVRLEADALLGRLHGGWALLPTIIGFERGGFDYLTRAQTWLAAAETKLRELPADRQAELAAGFAQRAFHVGNARALSYHAAATADGLEMDEITVSYAKLASGQAAQSVARWAGEELLPLSPNLAKAVAEAPELTISGGARELQLDLISGDPAIGSNELIDLKLDAVQQKLVDALRESDLTASPDASGWEVFDALGITETLVPEPGSPAILGQLDWCLVLEELGASCRDHTLIRAVRTFLDVYPQTPQAAEAFRQWARDHRAGLTPEFGLLTDKEAVRDRELLAIAAYALGVARSCLRAAQERAAHRIVANRPLLEYQGTSHRLAQCAVDLAVARAGLRRAASGEDDGEPAGHSAPAAAAASISTALDCAHTAVQVFGAAGTSNPEIVRLFRAAYALAEVTGSPRELWRASGKRLLRLGT